MSKPQAPLKDLIIKYITSDSWRGMPFYLLTTGVSLIGIDSLLLRIFNAGLQRFLGFNAADQSNHNSVFILGMVLAILGLSGILIDGYKSISRAFFLGRRFIIAESLTYLSLLFLDKI